MTGVGATLPPRRLRSDAERSSLAAFALAIVGLALSLVLIVASGSDTSQVRWWLVVAPVVVTAIPVLLGRYGVRVAAAVVLAGWCLLTGFSIGMSVVPALVAAITAVTRES